MIPFDYSLIFLLYRSLVGIDIEIRSPVSRLLVDLGIVLNQENETQEPLSGEDRTPCCETSTFPYSEGVFDQCLLLATKDLQATPTSLLLPGVAGPRFSKATLRVQAVVVEFDSNVTYSLSYVDMHDFFTQVGCWLLFFFFFCFIALV